MVQRRGAQPDANIVCRVDRWDREVIAESQLIQPTVRIDSQRSHRTSPVIFTGAVAAPSGFPTRRPSPGMIPIKVPPLGESIVEATVSRWLKREGEAVEAGETIVELETDKVTVEVPATTGGVLVRRTHQEGDVVGLGTVLGELEETAAAKAPAAVTPPAPDVGAKIAEPTAPPPTATTPLHREDVRASPGARRLATDEGVDLGFVGGTGRGGVVSKPDVVEHVARSAASPVAEPRPAAAPASPMPTPVPVRAPEPVRSAAPPTSDVRPSTADVRPPTADVRPPTADVPPPTADVPPPTADVRAPTANVRPPEVRETREKMSTRRRRIAEHLLESQHATAHLTTFNEIDMSVVEALRSRVKERIEKEHGVRLSFMPFFVRAACLALKQFPMVNARIDGDHIVYHHYVNLGIAVASEAGLVVPNVKDADAKGMIRIGRDIVEVAKKARDGKLVMDDLTGGTFTITNGGVFGSLLSTPIINYPQVAILGLHKIQDRAVVIDGAVVARPMMYVALSYDHRIIDGQQAVLFLVRVKELMEDPALMVVD
jgi:2-oxoglutarate dehydrogenase E2 component (dihydrolipoamide succinyltransferase)